ncbi:hypothetical protein C923_05004 [Plasmodium falciparum UGT5.1]|uniref:3'-5' exonuclease domain-containing protein n=1 Tax=Plasmodium falciparum UGT5.1 TaxID=1237627 RepID=W7JHS9_PLAFA|nr:hypothetical protein C923_05004 [Plasmodium falciparum UGT5.1]
MTSHISYNKIREKRNIRRVLSVYNFCSLNRFSWYRQDVRLDNVIYRKNYEYIYYNCIIRKCSRNYISTRNNIYIKNKIYDIIPYLCKGKDVKNITSNIIFYILQHLSTKNVVNSNEYKDNIKKIYFNLLKCYHKIFEYNNEYGEYIFSLFNDDIIISVSPSLRKKQKNIIQDILLNSLHFFFQNNITYKNKLNINLMCEIINYPKFLYVLHSINYDMNILKQNISVQNVDYLFSQYINKTNIYITTAIQFASFFKNVNMNIFTPFKKHGTFNYFLLLKRIVNKQLKNTLFLLLNDIECHRLRQEMLLHLLSSDDTTDLNNNIYIYTRKEEGTPSYKNYNILYFETLNRDMIQSNDVHLFKELVHSTPYNFNKNLMNKIKKNNNNINIPNKQMFKLYVKSLNDLCIKILNKKLNKKFQLANWNIRPLNQEQIIYACIDSYVLIKIEEMLIEKGYMSTCDSNNNQMMNLFLQKYKFKDSTWE